MSIDQNALADGPPFGEPWHAQVFALTMALHRAGAFTWQAWVDEFSSAIRTRPQQQQQQESVDDAYYRQWLTALQAMLARVDLASTDAIANRVDAWRRAYINTPHGSPVLLANADCPPPRGVHHHGSRHTPIAVSPAS